MAGEAMVRSGALAGAASACAFAAIHHLLISDIWFSLVPMLVAGAACGACLAWSYRHLWSAPSVRTWLAYNLIHVALLALLGIASIIVFEPVTTIPALVAADGPPAELISQATPLTVAFTVASTLLLIALWGRTLVGVMAILLTCTVLVLLVGLNVSALGLVHLPSGSLYLVVEMFGLILALAAVFALGFVMLERDTYFGRARSGTSGAHAAAPSRPPAPARLARLDRIVPSDHDAAARRRR